MNIRTFASPAETASMSTDKLRTTFLVENIFTPESCTTLYTDADRAIVGGAMPQKKSVHLQASKSEMAAEYFCERREVGVINVGGPGSILVDDTTFPLGKADVLYIGRGSKRVEFRSDKPSDPAKFFSVSYPAHKEYPTQLLTRSQADATELGSREEANRRTLRKYIHAGGMKSCQLVMGYTELEPGSVWNTLPPHTHSRRTEVYFYFALQPDAFVNHLMGKPDETRHLIVRNEQAVLSPSWSIHCGAGTSAYSFVWAMGGENQEFSDMDPVSRSDLR